jgi:hypothetical protein
MTRYNKESQLQFNPENFCEWELDKANYLIKVARRLGMNTKGYGELNVNPNSGYTYLWLEDYCFTLFMPISCELKKSEIYALWINSNDGHEEEISLTEETILEDLENWCVQLEKGINEDG